MLDSCSDAVTARSLASLLAQTMANNGSCYAPDTGQDFMSHLIACLTCIETVQDLFLGCSGMRVVTGALKRCVDVFSAEQDNFQAITALLTALNFAIENHGST